MKTASDLSLEKDERLHRTVRGRAVRPRFGFAVALIDIKLAQPTGFSLGLATTQVSDPYAGP